VYPQCFCVSTLSKHFDLFLQYFVLGEHFTKLGSHDPVKSPESKSPSVQLHSPDGAADLTVVSSTSSSKGRPPLTESSRSDDDARVKDILADTEMREILLDGRIQQLMQALRTDTARAQMLVSRVLCLCV